MNKADIRLEREHRARELREWAGRLDQASPSLANLFRTEADHIADPAARYDSFGATMMMGKVNGLVAAAHTLLEEWRAHH